MTAFDRAWSVVKEDARERAKRILDERHSKKFREMQEKFRGGIPPKPNPGDVPGKPMRMCVDCEKNSALSDSPYCNSCQTTRWETDNPDNTGGIVKMPIVPGSVYRNYRKEREDEEMRDSLSDIDPSLASSVYPSPKLYAGEFDDPVTGERLNMEATFHHNEDRLRDPRHRGKGIYHRGVRKPNIEASITEMPDKPFSRALANFRPHKHYPIASEREVNWDGEKLPQYAFESVGTNTDNEFQRRGYASALYDLAAYIMDRHDRELMPSSDQSDDGKKLWDSVMGSDVGAEPQGWRVRGDLG